MNIYNKALTVVLGILGGGIGFVILTLFASQPKTDTLLSEDITIKEALSPHASSEKDNALLIIQNMNKKIRELQHHQYKTREKIDQFSRAIAQLESIQSLELTQTSVNQDIESKVTPYSKSDEEIIETKANHLEYNLTAQDVDDQWSEHTRDQFLTLLDNEQYEDSDIVSVDCRSTLCRIDIEHADNTAAEQFMEELPVHMAWNNESFSRTETSIDGSVQTMLYFSKDGHVLSNDAVETDLE